MPSWKPVRHTASEDRVLFSFSDRPMQEALHMFREERVIVPDCPGRARAAADRIEAVVGEVFAEVHLLPPALITWQPAEGVWSVMDILCHIQELVPYWTSQALQIAQQPDRTWGRGHADADRLAAVQNTAVRSLADVERAVRAGVSESAAALGRLSDAALDIEAPSRNPRWGVRPASFVVDHLLVQHVEKHLGQIRRNVLQYRERHA